MAKLTAVVCILLIVHFSVAFDKVVIDERTLAPGGMGVFDIYQTLGLNTVSALIGVDLRIVDQDGVELDIPSEIFFHHFIAWSPSRVNTVCPELRTPGGFIVSIQEEMAMVHIPHPYGIFLHPTEAIYGNYMVLNHNEEESITYRLEVTFHFSDTTSGMIPVEGFRLTVPGCYSTDSVFDVPASNGPVEVHRDLHIAFSGTLIWLALHTHEGGLNGTITHLGSGDILYSSTMHYDDPEDDNKITSSDTYSPMTSVTVNERLRVAVTYDGAGHTAAMGAFLGYSTVTSQGHNSQDLHSSSIVITPL